MIINQSSGDQSYPAVASNGDKYCVVWQDLRRVINWDLYGTLVGPNGVENPAGQFLVNDAISACLSRDGMGYALTWQNATYGIDAMRLSAAGAPDSTLMRVAPGTVGQGKPAISAIGEDILIVYQKPDETAALRTFGRLITSWSVEQWNSDDIGAVTRPGEVGFDPPFITVHGSGAGIGGMADSFLFVWQSLEGDGQITARVLDFDPDIPSAMGGVMIREDLSVGARYAFLGHSRADGTVVFDRRVNAGAKTLETRGESAAWVRLKRIGDLIIAYQSDDGANWNPLGFTTINFGITTKIGLAVGGGGSGGVICSFDHVSVDGLYMVAGAGLTPKLYPSDETGGPFRILVVSDPGSYRVEITTNFSAWSAISNLTVGNAPTVFTDSENSGDTVRFYRVRKL